MRQFILLLLALSPLTTNATITFAWRCESATFDGTHDYSAGDSTVTETGTLTYGTTQVFAGTNSCGFDTTENGEFDSASILDGDNGSVQFAFYITTWGTQLFRFEDAGTDDYIAGQIIGTPPNGNVRLRIEQDGEGTADIETDSNNLDTGTWYVMTLRWDSASTYGEVEVYNSGGTLVDSATSSSVSVWPTAANMDVWRIGDVGSLNAGYFDAVLASDANAEDLPAVYDWTSYTELSGGGGGATVPIFQYHQLQRTQ